MRPANSSEKAPTIRIGTAGWTIPRLCSDQLSGEGSHLERYACTFLCAEINTTFYRPHRPATWQRWTASVPDNFRFAVKAPKTITHEAGLDSTSQCLAALATFLDQARLLGPKLGPILFQLPPKQVFEATRAAAFFRYLRSLHSGPIVFEPRHASWFTPTADALLLTHRIARAAADPARVPEAGTPGGAPTLHYYRLHGSPRTYYSAYTEAYLEALAGTLAQTHQDTESWVIFDNTASGAALGNALALTHLLAARLSPWP